MEEISSVKVAIGTQFISKLPKYSTTDKQVLDMWTKDRDELIRKKKFDFFITPHQRRDTASQNKERHLNENNKAI